MREENIKVQYETISIPEQRNLMEATQSLSRAITREEYIAIMLVYEKVVNRLVKEAEKQGIEI